MKGGFWRGHFLSWHWRCAISILSRLFAEKIVFPFLDYLKDPVVILRRDGKIVEANTAFLQMIGKVKDNVIDRGFEDFRILSLLKDGFARCVTRKTEQSEHINFEGRAMSTTLMPIMLEDEVIRVSVIFRDITNFIQVEKELLKRNKELTVISTLSNAFISAENIELVYGDILEKALLISDFNAGWLVLYEDEQYELKSSNGVSLDFKEKLREGKLDSIYDKVTDSSGPLFVLEAPEMPEELKSEGILFYAAIPLRVGRELMGILSVASRTEVVLDFDLASLLAMIGNSLSLIAEKIRLFQQTRKLAITDGLTGLYNSRYFFSALEAEIARTRRYETPFSIVLFDVDNFKKFNDQYGHQAGDDALRLIADVLKGESRKSDLVARYGGEEFIILLPNTSKFEAFGIANRIKDAVSNAVFHGDPTISLTVSGGVATCPEDALESKTLLYCADMAMYEAKAAGKKRVVSYKRRTYDKTGL